MSIRVRYAPKWVGEGRRIRILIESDSPISAEIPGELELIDRTPEESSGPDHRFYLRGITPVESTRIVFSSGGSKLVLGIEVIGEAEWDTPRKFGSIETPRIWPMDGSDVGLKTRHTVVSKDQIGLDKENPPECPPLEWSDDFIWELEPQCDIPRWHWVNLEKGCPVDGKAIFKTDGFYPWIKDPIEHRGKVKCPVDENWYPSNDIESGDHTTGPFCDDGWGYDQDGETYGFLAVATLWQVRRTYMTMRWLSIRFEATGDPEAARKLVIVLVSLAREHRYLAMAIEHRFRRYEEVTKTHDQVGPDPLSNDDYLLSSGLDEYCINLPGEYAAASRAYDLIFDRIDSDEKLLEFIHTKMPHLDSGEKIRAYIEKFFFRVGIQATLDGATTSNFPEPQRGLIAIVDMLDQPECQSVIDWLIDGEGFMGCFGTNFYYKDGAAFESTGGYNGIHVGGLAPIVDRLAALRANHPDLYSDPKYNPFETGSYYEIMRWPIEIVAAGRDFPWIGDTGGLPSAKEIPPMAVMGISHQEKAYESAVRTFGDDSDFRKVLEWTRARDQATAADEPPPPSPIVLPSRLSDGYGVGILESGIGDERRGLWLYYGDHPGHSHIQPMDIGLIAHKRNIVRHMGYPYSWNYMHEWDANWMTHHTVHVTDTVQPCWRSTVKLFAGGEGFQVVRAAGYGYEVHSPYRKMPDHRLDRTVALVDMPDGRFYAVDMYRVSGGTEHWWSFHGPPGEFSYEGQTALVPQNGGTALGPDVEYGKGEQQPDGDSRSVDSLSRIYDVERAEVDGVWSATWALKDSDGLKLRMTQAGPDEGEVVVGSGRSPQAPPDDPPYELKWSFRHRTGAYPLHSTFVSVIECERELPVESVEQVSSADVTGVKVSVEGGLTHWILTADETDGKFEEGKISFAGQVGFIEVGNDGVTRARLVGQGHLTWNGDGIVSSSPDWLGTISAVDIPARSVEVAAEEKIPKNAVGRYIMFDRAGDRFAYRIDEVIHDNGKYRLKLNWSTLIAEAKVESVDGNVVQFCTPLPLAAGRGYYRGAWLINHDRSAQVAIEAADGSWMDADSSVAIRKSDSHPDLVSAFPAGTDATIEEVAVGDMATICNVETFEVS